MKGQTPYADSAELYDFIYENSDFRDYVAEAEALARAIEKAHPNAKTILDVGCATGEHARLLSKRYHVDGIDIEPAFIERARSKNRGGDFRVASMQSFDMGKTYDVVMSLGSSIGYVHTLNSLTQALKTFERHLSLQGVILVEPWFSPEDWRPGSITMVTAETKDKKVCRMVRAEQKGRKSVLHFTYIVGVPEGVSAINEHHELALYTVSETLGAFDSAGLSARYNPKGLANGRGLYIGHRRETRPRRVRQDSKRFDP